MTSLLARGPLLNIRFVGYAMFIVARALRQLVLAEGQLLKPGIILVEHLFILWMFRCFSLL